jgi:hypothetical protein
VTFEIDMDNLGGAPTLTGVNLWTISSCQMARANTSGENMLKLELTCGEAKLKDNIMLGGGGWNMGRRKLIALGVPETGKLVIDPPGFVGLKVWVATKMEPNTWMDKKTGEERSGERMVVDIKALTHAGYQHKDKIPAGCTMPADDDCPFG